MRMLYDAPYNARLDVIYVFTCKIILELKSIMVNILFYNI